MTSADEPMYNIGAVARLTGIAEATLRVWERRYQFPRTTRTAGRHRLYASREVQRLQWVRQHIAQGMHPRLAIEALVRVEAASAAPPAAPPVAPTALAVPAASDEALQSYQQRLLQALVAYQHDAAAAVLAEAETHFSVETVARDLIGSVFFTIGESWRAGQLDVATEHFATGILLDYLRAAMRTTQPEATVRPVGLACAPGELHEGSLLILGVLLGRLHWPVLYLGQSFPLSDLAPLVARARPSVVVFVAMSEATALALADWPRQMPSDAAPPLIAFGGRAFSEHPGLIGRVSGQFLGATLQEGSATLHRILLALAEREG